MAVRDCFEATVRRSETVVRSQSFPVCCGSGARSRVETAARTSRSSACQGSGDRLHAEAVVPGRSWQACRGSGRCTADAAAAEFVVLNRR